MAAFTVRQIATDTIIPYAGNPRDNSGAVDKVAASIEEFGWRQPLVVDEDMVLLVGHTRLLAAKQLGHLRVPVHVAKGLTDAQKRQYRIADNRTGEEAKWVDDLLTAEILALHDDGADLALTGMSDKQLRKMLGEDGDVSGAAMTIGGDENLVIVECEDEGQCAALYAELGARGYVC